MALTKDRRGISKLLETLYPSIRHRGERRMAVAPL